jgi:RNA polymerase sigma factor (sigma-70 family)
MEALMRELAPQVLGILVRRYGQFDSCEDAVQEAMLEAAIQWPRDGQPGNPKAWLVTVASRRLTDLWRADSARRRREEAAFADTVAPAADEDRPEDRDDTLTLLYLCCHPALSAASQVALTLRAVGGLSTAEIASAFLVPEATMAQRISRAKQRIKSTGIAFQLPPAPDLQDRLQVVLQVLYLIFNEGYTATSGPELQRSDLTVEALRLTRLLHRLLPHDGEVCGLLALMLFTNARRVARSTSDGSLVPLAEQDRALWDSAAIAEGSRLITWSLASSALGPYQVQAAIAALHCEADKASATDWPQILALYQVLEQIAPNPMVTLNHAVAVAMVHGPSAGLEQLAEVEEALQGHHRLDAVKAHLLEMAGDTSGAREAYLLAARRTTSLPERRYLESRGARL